jgi:N-acetylneuraminic acid mutarotase
MLKITWTRGPNLPQGFQDSDGGIVKMTLVTACGFCSGKQLPAKPGRYPRGFLKKVWGLYLADPKADWAALPDFPGAARQENMAIVVGDRLYCWGGFSYSAPYCYKDGYCLGDRSTFRNGTWAWLPLPPLPWAVCSSGICRIGTKIYVFGGADYDKQRFYTETDRAGKDERLGAHLLVIDTKHLGAGWTQLADCPGTPRWVSATAAVGGKVYVIGGATGDLTKNGKTYGYCTVVDNWVYDPGAATWARLRDLPISSGNFPSGKIVFGDRYILLIGGHQYAHVANPDGTVRPKYGKAGRFEGKGAYHNDVFVYDTKSDLFGRADSLPINNNLPMAVVWGDEVFLIGGETGGGVVEGEPYGHHPDLLLRGKISLLPTEAKP